MVARCFAAYVDTLVVKHVDRDADRIGLRHRFARVGEAAVAVERVDGDEHLTMIKPKKFVHS